MRFQPGQSGNPAGRPKGTRNQRVIDGEAYARLIIEDAQVQARLLAMAQDGELSAELVKTLLAYAFGKPQEDTSGADSNGEPRSITISF